MADIYFDEIKSGDEFDLPPALGSKLISHLLTVGAKFYLAGNIVVVEEYPGSPKPVEPATEVVPKEKPAPKPEPEKKIEHEEVIEAVEELSEPTPEPEPEPEPEPTPEPEPEPEPEVVEDKPKPRKRGRPRKTNPEE